MCVHLVSFRYVDASIRVFTFSKQELAAEAIGDGGGLNT